MKTDNHLKHLTRLLAPLFSDKSLQEFFSESAFTTVTQYLTASRTWNYGRFKQSLQHTDLEEAHIDRLWQRTMQLLQGITLVTDADRIMHSKATRAFNNPVSVHRWFISRATCLHIAPKGLVWYCYAS